MRASVSTNFVSVGHLTGDQEGLDEFTLAAHGEPGEFLKPFAFRHVRFGIKPAGEQDDLFRRDVPLTHPRQKMSEQAGGSFARRTLGMRLAAVEPAFNRRLQAVGLGRVLRFDHSLGEPPQFLRAEAAGFPGVAGKLDDPVLFVARQPLNFLNDLNRCHAITLLVQAVTCKWGGRNFRATTAPANWR